MGRVISKVRLWNPISKKHEVELHALVDTGASNLMLPESYRPKLGELEALEPVNCTLADGSKRVLPRCGPVKIQLDGFPEIYNEVFFMPADSEGHDVEPLIGYIVLEQSRAGVDMVGHRLLRVDSFDLKGVQPTTLDGALKP